MDAMRTKGGVRERAGAQRMLRRRRAAGTIGALVLLVVAMWARAACAGHGASMPVADPPHPSAPEAARADEQGQQRMEAMRAIVQRESARLRAELDRTEGAQDYQELLARKTTVEAALLPMQLLRDAMLLAEAPAETAPDMLRALRVEYRGSTPVAAWRSPEDARRVRRAIAAWVPDRGGTRTVSLRARTASEAWVGRDAPPLLEWSVSAHWDGDSPAVHARCWWHEPASERRAIDFPLSPEGFDCWWRHDGVRLLDDAGTTHAESWGAEPAIFANPPDLFALIDGIRALRAADAEVSAATMAPLPEQRPSIEAPVVLREVRAVDGRLLRRERWQFAGPALRSLVIDQEPVQLVHHAVQGFELVSEVDGAVVARHPHRPESVLVQHPAGMRVAITFRRPDPARDTLPPGVIDDPAVTVPERVAVIEGTRLRAWVEFPAIAVAGAEITPGEEALVARTSARRAIAWRIDDAIARADAMALGGALDALAAQQEADEIPAAWRAMAIERVAVRLCEQGEVAVAQALVASRWLPLLSALGEDFLEATAHRVRSQGHQEIARMLETALPQAQLAPACDPADLQGGARPLFDAIRNAVEASPAVAREARGAIIAALCAELMDASPGIRAIAEARAGELGRDARAHLDLGRAQLDSDSIAEEGLELAAMRFARSVAHAAEVPRFADGARMELRQAVVHYAEAASRCTRALLSGMGPCALAGNAADADEAASDARERVLELVPLVGNPFAPAYCLAAAGALRDSPAIIAQELAALPSLAVQAAHQQRRAALIGQVVDSELGAARERAGRRQLARAVSEEAVAAFMRWHAAPSLSSGSERPGTSSRVGDSDGPP